DRRAGTAAIESLGEIGEAALGPVEEALDTPTLAPETRWRAVRVLARSVSPRASEILTKRLLSMKTDTGMRTRILQALRARQTAGERLPIERSDLEAVAEQTVAQIGRALALRIAHAKLRPQRVTPGSELIASLLRDKEIEGRERLFLLAGLL